MLKTDFVDWELDENNNLIFPIRYTYGEKAVKQGARVRLSLMKTEWFLNREIGMPFLPVKGEVSPAEAILGESYDEAKAISAVRSVLITTPGLTSITSIKTLWDPENRVLRVRWEGVCVWGDTVSGDDALAPALAA